MNNNEMTGDEMCTEDCGCHGTETVRICLEDPFCPECERWYGLRP